MPSEDFIVTRDPNEVAKIQSNPQYANWKFEYVDGEYRFYSPNYKKQEQSEEEQINQLKSQISNYNNQIETLLTNMQPYMQIPKVNQEISKVIEKNNEINSSQIIDSLQDYKIVVEIKQKLVSYLESANKFVRDNVGEKQQKVVEQQPVQPQKQQIPTVQSFEEIMAEFEQPDLRVRPERMYNFDGTYTMEYVAYLANTPLGFNQTIYDQLMQENALKRQQNEEQMTSGGRQM